MSREPRHRIAVTVDQQQIGGWTEYQIDTSMIEPSDAFSMRRPFDSESWDILRRDARIRVSIDGSPVLDGFLDKRSKHAKEGTLEISGRDRAGRLVQESAPRINYNGLELTEAIRKLADPWFSKVTLSDARNRLVRTGKGRRIPSGTEPIVIRHKAERGRVHPGEFRWAVIQEIVSQAGLIAWSSADGKELFVGRPNHDQAPSFTIVKAKGGVSDSQSTCLDLTYEEDNGDRYSVVCVVGNGGGTQEDFGESVSSRRAVIYDNEANTIDGTGRDFVYPKRLLMPERNFDSNADAARVAAMEQARRDFRRVTISAEMPYHGQFLGPPPATLFAPNTVASITDQDFAPILELDALIYSCSYQRSRTSGETTRVEMVPAGTEIVL